MIKRVEESSRERAQRLSMKVNKVKDALEKTKRKIKSKTYPTDH